MKLETGKKAVDLSEFWPAQAWVLYQKARAKMTSQEAAQITETQAVEVMGSAWFPESGNTRSAILKTLHFHANDFASKALGMPTGVPPAA